MGHAGLFSTQGDMVKFAQGVLREQVISKMTIRKMARNRTGFRRADGTYQQYRGALCYVKHPVQYFSEIPAYESDEAEKMPRETPFCILTNRLPMMPPVNAAGLNAPSKMD